MANTSKVDNSKRVAKDKRYILVERNLIIYERLEKGFSQSDIARMLNVHKSVVTRIIIDTADEYKKWLFARGA